MDSSFKKAVFEIPRYEEMHKIVKEKGFSSYDLERWISNVVEETLMIYSNMSCVNRVVSDMINNYLVNYTPLIYDAVRKFIIQHNVVELGDIEHFSYDAVLVHYRGEVF